MYGSQLPYTGFSALIYAGVGLVTATVGFVGRKLAS